MPGSGERLLIRGGTSSVGMAAVSIASGYGAQIAATTRRRDRIDALTAAGVDHAFVDDGASLAESVHAVWPDGPDRILDLVGTATAAGSLRLVRRGGTVCAAGSLSGWTLPDFEPIAMIPSGTALTAFHSRDLQGSAGRDVLQRIVDRVEAGICCPAIDRVFDLGDIVAAHRYMENDAAIGKLVVMP